MTNGTKKDGLTVRENLIAAKALIDTPEKWGKHWPPSGGAMCIYHATTFACESFDDSREAEDFLREALPAHVGHTRLSHWNDHPDTTHADVMALFDRAIAAQESSDRAALGGNADE